MTTPQIKIVNAEIGEEVIRDMNEAELAQWEADKAEADQKAALQAEAIAAKEAAQAKLAILGLTTDDLKALGL